MFIRDTATAVRVEAAADEVGKLRLVLSWPLTHRGLKADERDQLGWLVDQLRGLDVPFELTGALTAVGK